MKNRLPPIILVHAVPPASIGRPRTEHLVVEPIRDEQVLEQHVTSVLGADSGPPMGASDALHVLERLGLDPLTITPSTLAESLGLPWLSPRTRTAIRDAAKALEWPLGERHESNAGD